MQLGEVEEVSFLTMPSTGSPIRRPKKNFDKARSFFPARCALEEIAAAMSTAKLGAGLAAVGNETKFLSKCATIFLDSMPISKTGEPNDRTGTM